jgi:hypothetical protein
MNYLDLILINSARPRFNSAAGRLEVRHLVRLRTDSSVASLNRRAGFQPVLPLTLTSKMLVGRDRLEAYLPRDRALPLWRDDKISRTRHGRETEESRCWDMKKLKLLSLVGITSIALANAGWAAGHGGGGGGGHGGGGGGFHGGGFGGGGFHGGGFRGGRFSGGNFHGGGFRGDRFHHGFSNDVFIGDFGFPGWWGWGYPYGYYGYGYYPYDYYGYGYGGYPYGYGYGRYDYYGGPGYGYSYGSRRGYGYGHGSRTGYGYRYGSRSGHSRSSRSR